MIYNILIFLICYICIQLFFIALKDILRKKEVKKSGNKMMENMLEARLKATYDEHFNKDSGINTYKFKDLPEDIQKVILEYIPPSFYEVLGDESFRFLNEMDTIQLREFNKATIESYRTIIRTKEMFNVLDIISTTIIVSLFWLIFFK